MTSTVHLFALLWMPLLGLAASIVLLIIGLRGRRVGDHPVCGRCGFDLFGNPGAARFPECGAELGLAGAVLTGHRQRRRGAIWLGGAMLLGLAWAGVAGSFAARGVDFNTYKPLGWLLRDMASANAATRDDALAELRNRLQTGRLGNADIERLTTRALDLQGDRSKPWVPAWGDLIESARAAGKLPDAAWARYARQAPVIGLEVRPRVRRGDVLPFWVVNGPARVGANSRLVLRTSSQDRRVTVGGLELPPNPGSSTNNSLMTPGGSGKAGDNVNLAPLLDRLRDGPQTLRVVAALKVYDSWPEPGKERPPLATADMDVTVPWALDPADAQAVRAVNDPALRPGVERAVAVERVAFVPGNYPYLSLNVAVNGVPVGVSYAVAVRTSDGREIPAGGLACPKGTTNHAWGLNAMLNKDVPVPDTIDVIFRPDPKAAARTTDTFEASDGEVVVRGVKVERPKGS